MVIWGLLIFSDFVVDKFFWSLRARDFGPVRTCRCYPSHACGAGPSRSRSHGRLRRPKSLDHPALLLVTFIIIFLALLRLGDDAPHLLPRDYLHIGTEPCAAMEMVCKVGSGVCGDISFSGDTEEVH